MNICALPARSAVMLVLAMPNGANSRVHAYVATSCPVACRSTRWSVCTAALL
jgi:hypothetical protein